MIRSESPNLWFTIFVNDNQYDINKGGQYIELNMKNRGGQFIFNSIFSILPLLGMYENTPESDINLV